MRLLFRYAAARDWRIWLGLFITTSWISLGIWYVRAASITGEIDLFSLETIGNFLEGAFAPLAFLWLVLGLFIQQRELARNTEMLRRTSLQSEKQTQAIAATEMNARQETFFKIAENVKRQLGSISGMLFISSMGPAGSGKYSEEKIHKLWNQLSTGDYEVYSRMFLMLNAEELEAEGGYATLLYGTEIRARHTHNFQQTFERLLKLARNCDIDSIIEDALMQTGHGLFYQRICENKK
ncbi:MAG: hypothetical protein AAF512_11845 [Pseudomonadota bacterium]